MVELRDILESDEVTQAVNAIEELLSKRDWVRKDPNQKSFEELALGSTFKAKDVLEIILSDEPAYPGFKEVLAAGFVGWVLFPEEHDPSLNYMTHAILNHMNQAEAVVGFTHEPVTLARDIVARYVLVGFDFLSDIYHPFGGYEAFTRSNSLEISNILNEVEHKKIETTIRALTYLHHGADSFKDAEYDFAPSLNRAVTILGILKKRFGEPEYKRFYVSRSLLLERWSEGKDTLAFVYAASTVKVGRKSLLQVIQSGKFSYEQHETSFREWISRTRYVTEHIFKKMERTDLQQRTMRSLPDVEPQKFAPPKIKNQADPANKSEAEAAIVTSNFRKRFRNNQSK